MEASPPSHSIGWLLTAFVGLFRMVGNLARRRRLERGPAAVFFVPAGPLLTGVVEQMLTYVLPDGLFPAQSYGVGLLDLDGAAAAGAGDPQQVSLNVGQPLHPDGRTGRRGVCVGADVVEDDPPILAATRRPGRRTATSVARFRGRRPQRPVSPSVFGSACASSRVGRSCHD
jgi:hypothetical protein